ncbi:hypothetical protein ACLOJK_025186 [Asimina triloba]
MVVSSNDIFGGLLLQAPSIHDTDQREIFCLYLFPGELDSKQVFKREVVFLVDISESMMGSPLENVKNALVAALSKLSPADSFNIIAFNEQTYLFSSSLVFATIKTAEKAVQWMSENCIAGGGTNIRSPLTKAIDMLSSSPDSTAQIFLITDGAVEDEHNICQMVKANIQSRGSKSPRISTFGIGKKADDLGFNFLVCLEAHLCGLLLRHFLLLSTSPFFFDENGWLYVRETKNVTTITIAITIAIAIAIIIILTNIFMSSLSSLLKLTSKPHSIEIRMQRFFMTASSSILSNLTTDIFDCLDDCEAYAFPIPDLSSECPLILSGRYNGEFPESLKARGVLADMTSKEIGLKVQKVKDIPLDKVFAKQQIDVLTVQAWLTENKQLEEKVMRISRRTGVISEYTRMVLVQTVGQKFDLKSSGMKMAIKLGSQKNVDSNDQRVILLSGLTLGFGNITATKENRPPAFRERKVAASIEILNKASDCCTSACYFCCCPCFIQALSQITGECWIVLTQLCSALSCFGCIECCVSLVGVSMAKLGLLLLLFSVSFVLFFPTNASEEKEMTLAMIKPDGLSGNYTEKIKTMIMESGFSISREMSCQLDEESVTIIYAEHSGKSFFPGLVKYMTSIRAMCGMDSERNCVHGSDSPQSAAREIAFFFGGMSQEEAVGVHDEL